MASTMNFSLITAFIIVFIQSVTSGSLYEWDVERSSVNPLSYTEEIRYSRDRTTQRPGFDFFRRKLNCPENEHFSRCDANCQKTCDNYQGQNRCPRACVWGCVCNTGFVRGPDNKCIEPKECPAKPNAESQHLYVTLNPPPYTDDDYHIPSSGTKSPPDSETETPQFEETEIPPIRHIKSSYKCPGSQSIWVPCTAHCQRTCSNKDDKNFKCRPFCVPGCICEQGLVLGPESMCIEEEKCPPESFSEKNSYVTLNPPPYTDDDYHIPSSGTKSPPDSETDNPQFKETDIPSKSHTKTPHECPPRERYVPCGRDCQRNCSNKDDNDFSCKPVCIPGCICEIGLVRGPDGKCIEKDKCSHNLNSEQEPSHSCPPRERYVPCGGHCQRNCSNKNDEEFDCRPVCIPGCVCEEGLVKGPDGKCIEKDKCPDNSDSERDEEFQVVVNPCPDEYTCRKMCRMTIEMKGGECVGPNMKTCRCY